MARENPQILLTNDDGIQSPGLWAAASSLETLGFVHVVAPRDQCSGTGRSLPKNSDGLISVQQVHINGKDWTAHAVGGTPAQAVLHGVLEILPRKPDLVVSGINYGENLGIGVTVSGTVGAALEGAAQGYPALAISLETETSQHLSYSSDVDFSTAGYFTAFFSKLLLERQLPPDVHVLKVDIPAKATPETPWKITRLFRQRYYNPTAPKRSSWDQPGIVGYQARDDHHLTPTDTDVYALNVLGIVAATPLSLDLTSRVDLGELEGRMRG